jgi:hypothetical protein
LSCCFNAARPALVPAAGPPAFGVEVEPAAALVVGGLDVVPDPAEEPLPLPPQPALNATIARMATPRAGTFALRELMA